MSHARFQELMNEVDSLPMGGEQRALLDEAVALAAELGDVELEFQARVELTTTACFTGDTETMLGSFAWCLGHYDAEPSRFSVGLFGLGGRLLWQFKWMTGALTGSPAFTREQIDDVLADMESRYRAAGLGPSAVIMSRFDTAWATGRYDEAERLRVTLVETPRDSHSDCAVCVSSKMTGFLLDVGREAEAIALVDQMVAEEGSCAEEPEYALSRVLVPLLRAGRMEDARQAHLQSYRLAKDNADQLSIVASNIQFCALSGNHARALSLLERHLGWLAHDSLNGADHERALTAFAVTLDAVVAAGYPDAVIRGAEAPGLRSLFGERETAWTAGDLAAACWREAQVLAAQFDARNSNAAHSDRLSRARTLADMRFDVPISREPILPRVAVSPPLSIADQITRTLDLADAGAIEAVAQARELSASATGEDRVRLLGILASGSVATDELSVASAALAERVDLLRTLGQPERADLEATLGLARFGAMAAEADLERAARDLADPAARADVLSLRSQLIRPEDPERAADLARKAVSLAELAGDPRRLARCQQRLGTALLGAGDTAGFDALAEQLLSQWGPTSGARAQLLLARARRRGKAEEFGAGAADADAACRILDELGAASVAPQAYALAAALYRDADRPADAVTRLRVAVRAATETDQSHIEFNYQLGAAQLAAGSPEDAAETLSAVLEAETQAEVTAGSRAQTAMLLAQALEQSGDTEQAVAVWRYAAELFEADGERLGRVTALINGGRLLVGLDDSDDALAQLRQAVELARAEPDEVDLVAYAVHQLGQALARTGDAEAFAHFDDVARLATAEGADWLLADVTDSRARAHAVRNEVDEAVSAALQAADGYAASGDVPSAAGAELLAARILVVHDRYGESVPVFRAALDRQVVEVAAVVALELGDVLERLGRTVEAVEVRALGES
ncbi:MAG: hypothetical protein ACK5LN_08835 [Propioniciclava sp.]